jgi:hypothetical protein
VRGRRRTSSAILAPGPQLVRGLGVTSRVGCRRSRKEPTSQPSANRAGCALLADRRGVSAAADRGVSLRTRQWHGAPPSGGPRAEPVPVPGADQLQCCLSRLNHQALEYFYSYAMCAARARRAPRARAAARRRRRRAGAARCARGIDYQPAKRLGHALATRSLHHVFARVGMAPGAPPPARRGFCRPPSPAAGAATDGSVDATNTTTMLGSGLGLPPAGMAAVPRRATVPAPAPAPASACSTEAAAAVACPTFQACRRFVQSLGLPPATLDP